MNIKKEDLIKIRNFEDRFFYGISLDAVIDGEPEVIIKEKIVKVKDTKAEAKVKAQKKELAAKEAAIAKLMKELEDAKEEELIEEAVEEVLEDEV